MKEYGFKLPDGRILDIEANDEHSARLKLLDFLFEYEIVEPLGHKEVKSN